MLGMQVSFNIWDVLINLVFSYIATVGFALTVNIPHRVIHWSGICGCAGWMVYWLSGRMAKRKATKSARTGRIPSEA